MARQWYYREPDETVFGPFSGDEMRKLVDLGRVHRETLVYADERHGWFAAKRIKDLFRESGPGRGPEPAATDPEPAASSDQESLTIAWPIVDEGDLDRPLASARSPRERAFFLQVLLDPRGASEEALSPGRLAFAIGMIVASAGLYVLLWVPFLYGVESANDGMTDLMRRFPGGMPRVPRGGSPFGPRGMSPGFPFVADSTDPGPSPGTMRRVFNRLGEIGPKLFLAAAGCLGVVGFLGTFSMAALAPERRPRFVRLGATALGFSLTPLVCLLSRSCPIGLFVSTEVGLLCAYLGVFVSVLFYHEALQSIGGIPLNRAVYCTPLVLAAGAYLLVRNSAVAWMGLMMGGFPF